MAEGSPTSMTIEEFADVVSGSVVGPLSERLDALESRLDAVAGRAQLDGLSERVDALSGSVSSASASLSEKVEQAEQAALMAGEEIGPVIGEEIGSTLITLFGQLLELADGDEDGASDVLTELQGISDTLIHPAMTTNFADYTVLEALLLLLVVGLFIKSWQSALKDGFSWLR